MPQYKKVFDIGTYTGNGGQYRVGIPTKREVGPSGFQDAGSTRFRGSGSTHLTRTPGSAGNRKTWTWSAWIKRSTIGTYQMVFNCDNGTTDSTFGSINFQNTDTFNFGAYNQPWRTTTGAFRDTSVWNHFIVAFDTTQATASNRVKVYVNGVQITSFGASNDPALNTDYGINQSAVHNLGKTYASYGNFDGYLSELYFVDGQQLTSSSFGEFNSDGIWVPKAYSGTYGTNGFYLPMNTSANYATDQSGNGNNWTPSGFNVTTANTTYDIMTDSPTDYLSGSMTTANNAGNYCTWNPIIGNSYLVNGTATVTNGALTVGDGATTYGLHGHGTIAVSSGKWYWEITCSSIGGSYGAIGIVNMNTLRTGGSTNNGYYYISMGGIYDTQPVQYSLTYSGAASYTTGDVIGVAMDLDAGTLTFYKNGVSQGALPVTITSGNYTPAVGDGQNATTYSFTLNAGQRPFSYTPPSGYKALNTYNITRPADSSLWFYGDTPDLMWIKNRSRSSSNIIQDTVRGIGLNMFTDLNYIESSYPYVMEMSKFGMSLQYGTGVNYSGDNFVYWAWKAGSNTSSTSVTNNDGAVTSQVSVNKLSGFSIVTGTTVSTGGSTFGHGLGVTPDLMIVKIRSAGSTNWHVYHSSLGYLKYLLLNSTASVTTEVTPTTWGTSPTSSAFTLGGNWQGGYNIVAYLWAAVPGYSAFGSYTGNSSSDGTFVYTGFRPRWILFKNITYTSGTDWGLYDSTRDAYNVGVYDLYPNTSGAETSAGGARLDFLSNGFKLRHSSIYMNNSSYTYMYAAFAEIPFKYARAR